MEKREENSVESLSAFLKKDGAENGYKFSEVTIAGEFELRGLQYHILKYRRIPSDGKWFLGICGGYFEKEDWHSGFVHASTEHFDAFSAKEKGIALAEKLCHERVAKRAKSLSGVPLLAECNLDKLFDGTRRKNSVLTEDLYLMIDNLGQEGYLNAELALLTYGIEAGFYTRKELEEDLDCSLFYAYALININTADSYKESERLLAKTEKEGLNNPIWCYRYSVSLMYNRKYLKSYDYAKKCAVADPDYPWGYLQLARISYKLGKTDEALNAVEKGLELVPGDYEFATTKKEIEEKRPFREMLGHYIDPEADQEEEKDKYIPSDECR